MKNKLYISDLDGTLLNDNAMLSNFTLKNLNTLIEKGLHFTVASARSVISMQKILKGLKIKLPVIEFNGAFISDLRTGEHVIVNEINPEIKYDILNDIKKYVKFPFISSFDGKRDRLYYVDIQNEGCKWYVNDRKKNKDIRLTKVESLRRIINEQVVCFTIIDTKENLKELSLLLEEKYEAMIEVHFIENEYSPGWHWLTIHDVRSTKDQAIKELIKITGHNLEDLIVFGDNTNDIKMFKISYEAIAVKNAKDELKKYADKIIGLNEEDSVVKYIIENIY